MTLQRHIRHLVCSLIAVAQCSVCFAQNKISGRIIEENTMQPITGAYICFMKDNVITGHCFSGPEGEFAYNITDDSTPDTITVSLLGYSSVKTGISEGIMEIRMEEKTFSINAASISETIIEEKGDTVTYTVGAFREREDVVIADVLNRLPGMAVTESGGILHNGRSINKFYIEGLDLLGNRYGVVTKNLSPDDIARVEVYENHQPIKALKGIILTDQSAVNIILKESARNSWLFNGDLSLGVSDKPLFDAKTLVTRLSKKNQDLYLIKGNNIGNDIFKEIREQEYFGKTGAFVISEGNADSDFRSSLFPKRNSHELPKEYWYDNLSGMGSLNHLQAFENDIQMRLSMQIATEKYSELSGYHEIINTGDGNDITIKQDSHLTDNVYFITGTLSFEKNTENRFWTNDLQISGQYRNDVGYSAGKNNDYIQTYDLPSLKIENQYRTVIKTSDRRTIDISSETEYIMNNHSAIYSINMGDAAQKLAVSEFRMRNKADYSFKAGSLYFNSSAFLNMHHLSRYSALDWDFDGKSILSEQYVATEVTPGFGLSTTFSKGSSQLRFNLPLYLKMIFGDIMKISPSAAPRLTYRLDILQDLTFSANAMYQIDGSGVESFGNAVIMQDYRRLSLPAGKQTYQTLSASASLNYSNNPAMFFATLSGDYSSRSSDRTASNLYTEHYTLTEFADMPTSFSQYGVSGSISKYFGIKSFVIDINMSWHAYDSREFLQGSLLDFKGDRTEAGVSIRSSALRWLSVDASAKYSNDRTYSDGMHEQHRVESTTSISVKPMKQLMIDAGIYHLWFSSTDNSNIPILSSGITWSFKRFSVFAECRNMLGTEEMRKEFLYPYRTVIQTNALRGREYLFGLRMSL